jgi:hypothetical protein
VKKFALTTAILAAAAAFCAMPASAMDEATKAAAADCQKPDLAPEKGIAACTTILAVKMPPKSTTAMHYYRGAFYVAAKNNAKAKTDFDAAVSAYENDPAKADWPPDFVGLVASSYSFRAQIEVEAQDCSAAKADYGKAAATEREVSQRETYEKMQRTACQ